MKIKRIRAWQVDLPLHEGSYKWLGRKSVDVFDSTIVGVETDEGVTGYGEVCGQSACELLGGRFGDDFR